MRKALFGLLSGSLISALSINGFASIFAHGPHQTLGHVAQSQQLSSVALNPASGWLVLDRDESMRFSYLSSFGLAFEYGNAENFTEELDELADLLDEDNITLDQADDTLDRFNKVIASLAEEGYFRGTGDLPIPALPAVFKMPGTPGNVVVDADSMLLFKGSVLSAPFSTTGSCQDLICLVDDERYETKTSLYIKGAELLRLSVGYSQPVREMWTNKSYQGSVIMGGRLNIFRLGLSKQVITIDSIEDDDISDVIVDDYVDNQEITTEFGLDVGVIYLADRFQIGLTIANINEPEFEFGAVGVDCTEKETSSMNNCFAALDFVNQGQIDSQEVYTMSAVSTLEGSVRLIAGWQVSASMDLGEYNDPVGDEVQWMSFSTAYYTTIPMMPDFRAGYRKNLAGEELSTVNFGLTLGGVFNADFNVGLEKTEVDGSSYPRQFGFSLGFEKSF